MKMMKRWWLAGLAAGVLAASAQAQVAEFAVSGGASRLGDKELGSGYFLDNGWRLAFRLTLNNWAFFGHEFGYAYNRTALDFQQAGQTQRIGGMAIHQGFYNFLVYATPEGSIVRPFATGGGHFSNFVPPGASATQGQGDNQFGFNYGGGLKVRVGDKWQVRFDARQFVTGKPFGDFFPVSGSLRQTEISLGLGLVM
jgi:opacity protein-like surface antigen